VPPRYFCSLLHHRPQHISDITQKTVAWFGFTDTALLWIQSYLSFRSFSVKKSEVSSQSYPLACGVPHCSVLGPLLFIFYTTGLSLLIKASSVDHHLYADDTQLFVSFSPNSFSESIDHLLHGVSEKTVQNCFCQNFVKFPSIVISFGR